MLRIRELRLRRHLLQKEMASQLGIPANTFNQYENGRREPDLATLARIAKGLGITVDQLMGLAPLDDDIPSGGSIRRGEQEIPLLPVIGKIACGPEGGIVCEEVLGYETADAEASGCFYLPVGDSSMEPQIQKGDLALIRRQDTVEDGMLAAVVLPDKGCVLRRIVRTDTGMILQSFCPQMSPEFLSAEEAKNLVLAGRVLYTIRKMVW